MSTYHMLLSHCYIKISYQSHRHLFALCMNRTRVYVVNKETKERRSGVQESRMRLQRIFFFQFHLQIRSVRPAGRLVRGTEGSGESLEGVCECKFLKIRCNSSAHDSPLIHVYEENDDVE